MDNTIAPVLQKPLELGADAVLHSVTKYLNRQSTALGGAVVGNKNFVKKFGREMFEWYAHLGVIMHPLAAWLVLNNQYTLGRDMRLFSDNAYKIADFLAAHPKIKRLYYPGHPSSPHYELAQRQMPDGASGLLAFEMKNFTAAKKLVDSLKEINLAPHLGDSRYLAIHPASTTHSRLSLFELAEANITKNLVRLSAGLGPVDKVINELDKILRKL